MSVGKLNGAGVAALAHGRFQKKPTPMDPLKV
jgi:hypothetical protein